MPERADAHRIGLRRAFWLGAGVLVVAGAIVALAAVVQGRFGETDGEILATLLVLLLCGSVALAALALVERGHALPVAYICLVGAPVAAFLLLGSVWTWQDEQSSRWGAPAFTAFLLTLAALLVTTLRLLLTEPRLVRTLWPAVVVAAPAAAGIAAGLAVTNGGHDTLGRTAGALAILAGAGYLLGPILQRVMRERSPGGDLGQTLGSG